MLHYRDVSFDDYQRDQSGEEPPTYWSRVCDICVQEHGIRSHMLDEDAGHGICGVKGCERDSNHYIDFLPPEAYEDDEG